MGEGEHERCGQCGVDAVRKKANGVACAVVAACDSGACDVTGGCGGARTGAHEAGESVQATSRKESLLLHSRGVAGGESLQGLVEEGLTTPVPNQTGGYKKWCGATCHAAQRKSMAANIYLPRTQTRDPAKPDITVAHVVLHRYVKYFPHIAVTWVDSNPRGHIPSNMSHVICRDSFRHV